MKIMYFNDFRLGILKGANNETVVDVMDVVKDIPHTGPHDLINNLIENFEAYRAKLQAAADKGAGVPVSSVRIRPPLPRPTTIDCMAVNYMEDGTRDAPAPINAFHKAPTALEVPGNPSV
jgi:2-keto-4-pentenoate hydratase/2-oxohepta-3-ene-1,7-dioic acid hydratase in catechol pathway